MAQYMHEVRNCDDWREYWVIGALNEPAQLKLLSTIKELISRNHTNGTISADCNLEGAGLNINSPVWPSADNAHPLSAHSIYLLNTMWSLMRIFKGDH